MTMRYLALGRSGLRVSELCLGTMTFGEDWQFGASKEESRAIWGAYRDAGGNFIDGANTYTQGTSETLIGEFMKGERSRVVLATKYSLSTDPDDVNAGGNHRKSLRHAVEDSLKRLGTDYVDLLWIHAWDGMTPVEETMRALDDLVRSGKALYVGASNMPAWLTAQAGTLAELRGWSRFVGIQAEYSLIERSAEHELLPMAQAFGMAALAWAPLGGGVLAGGYKLQGTEVHIGETKRGARMNRERIDHRTMEIAQEAAAVAEEIGATPAQVALAWMRQNGKGVLPIVGARTRKQCEQNLASLSLSLDAAHMRRLNDASADKPPFPHGFLASAPLRYALFGKHPPHVGAGDAVSDAAPIHAVAVLRAKPGNRAALAAAFREILERVRNKAGCLEYALANPLRLQATGAAPAHEDEVTLVERWQSREALEAHLADPDYRRWFETIRPLIDAASMQALEREKQAG
jgi:aryl-alcohol dehydrogenase-like predicted oxidoreductase/quinol monooxygenase YgiN